MSAGEKFLAGLFDADLNLLPEYKGSRTYWLFHDNYLAAHLLEKSRPDLSERIRREIKRYGVTHSGKIEILFGEAARPLPFRNYVLTNVAHVGNKVIRTEIVSNMVSVGWRKYADLLFLYAIAQPQPLIARRAFYEAYAMWNGEGFYDAVAAHTNLFATYKLALYAIAARRLGIVPLPQIITRLESMQNQDGGWVTDYKLSVDEPVGLANVETTCLALLALGESPIPRKVD